MKKLNSWLVVGVVFLIGLATISAEIHRIRTRTTYQSKLRKPHLGPKVRFEEVEVTKVNTESEKVDSEGDDSWSVWWETKVWGHPRKVWILSAMASSMVGLTGIIPLLIIPADCGFSFSSEASSTRMKALLSFAVGGLLGDVFLHLLPEAWKNVDSYDNRLDGYRYISMWFLSGLLSFYFIEKMVGDEGSDDEEDKEKEEEKEEEDEVLENMTKEEDVSEIESSDEKMIFTKLIMEERIESKSRLETPNNSDILKTSSHRLQPTLRRRGNNQNTDKNTIKYTEKDPVKDTDKETVIDTSDLNPPNEAYNKDLLSEVYEGCITEPHDPISLSTSLSLSVEHVNGDVNKKGDNESEKDYDDREDGKEEGEEEVDEDVVSKESIPVEKAVKIKVSGWLNLVANIVDNFTHGLAVAGSFCISPKMGLLTTFAILLHEIPHEIGDFAILLQAGFDRWKAAKAQLMTATGGIIGAMIALSAESVKSAGDSTAWILPFTAGGFVNIALVTIVPDLVKEKNPAQSLKQFGLVACGIFVMALVTALVE